MPSRQDITPTRPRYEWIRIKKFMMTLTGNRNNSYAQRHLYTMTISYIASKLALNCH